MKSYEQQLFLKNIRRFIDEKKLIQKGDRIVVGLSGGKDSMLLLYALVQFMRYNIYDFEVIGVTVNHGMLGSLDAMSAFLKAHDIPWYVHEEPYEERLSMSEADGFSACYTCARLRKGILKRYAIEHGYQKIAFGHTKDDYVETLLMNIMQSGRLAGIPASVYDEHSGLTLIRPMLSLDETRIMKANEILKMPIVPSNCPFGSQKKRAKADQYIQKINEIVPGFSDQLARAMQHIHPDRL